MKKSAFALLLLAVISCGREEQQLDLSGTWKVSLDSLASFHEIKLPGTTDQAGLGDSCSLVPAMERPQLQKLSRKHSFIGQAYYIKTIEIPSEMAGRSLELKLERVLWKSSLWVDGVKMEGEEESLTTPHRHIIQNGLNAGQHELMLLVDNRKIHDISWRDLAHSYTDDTQIKWNGVLGEMTLRVLPDVELADVEFYPDSETNTAKIKATVVRHNSAARKAIVSFKPDCGSYLTRIVNFESDVAAVEGQCRLNRDATLWDEFSPEMHTLKTLCNGKLEKIQFGVRSFKAENRHFYINGRKLFLRGTLDCCIFPLTGTPPMEEDGWIKEFKTCKEWGLNHVRFHSWCPPDAAFRAADKLGLYLQVELPIWSHNVRGNEIKNFLKDEFDRICEEYGNHPSFCMLSGGNELDGDYAFFNEFLKYMKTSDPRHLYTNATYTMGGAHKGRPEPEDEYLVASRTYLGQIRGQDYFGREYPDFTKDYSHTAEAGYDVPLVSHEIGQYAVYPQLSEIKKYTGVLDPINFKSIAADLESKGRIDKAADYTLASGKFAAVLYKEEIERALKTPGLAGFQLLGLQDFSGQGTALVGLVDTFWDNKGLVSEKWFRQFCSDITPLARFSKACWTNDEVFSASMEVANYSSNDIQGELVWTLDAGNKTIASGKCEMSMPTGQTTPSGVSISADLSSVKEASRLELRIDIPSKGKSNSWSIWVYPAEIPEDAGTVTVCNDFREALTHLSCGKKVLLCPHTDILVGEPGRFLPVFWSPIHFPKEAGTMGILCNPSHPALASFPTEAHSDWQWWYLANHSKALNLDGLSEVGSIVEAVDNFTSNRRLSYIFETKCRNGSLLFCAMDIESDKPESVQLRRSLLEYMNSASFAPEGSISVSQLRKFFK